MDEDNLQAGLKQIALDWENLSQQKRSRIEAIDGQIKSVKKKIYGLMQAFDGDEDEIVVAVLRERVNTIKRAKSELIAERETINTEQSQILLAPNKIDSIVKFAHEIRRKMNGATYENKLELIKLLNVRVDLVHEGDTHRLEMSCDLPNSNYAKVTHRKSTMLNFCIKVSGSIPLPRRSKKVETDILIKGLFTSMMLMDNELVTAS